MENAINLREQPITSHFLDTLALLEFTRRLPAPPPYPSGNDEEFSQWQSQMDRRRSIYDELRLQYLRQLVMAIPQKQGLARAASLQTLLDFRSEEKNRMISDWDYQIYVAFRLDESFTINIANCKFKSVESLKQKLLQFPPGTVFKLVTPGTGGDDSKSEEVFQQIKSFLKEHGMNLERKTE